MKHVVTLFTLALLLALNSPVFAAKGVRYASLDAGNMLMASGESKFAFVDIQKILAVSYAGKEAKAKLDADVLKAEMEKNSREQELNKMTAELEKQGIYLSETERIVKQKTYEAKLQDYRQFVSKITEELRAENNELVKVIVDKVTKIIQEYGRNNGSLGIFFKNESMVYLDDKLDITDAVLQALNAM